MKRKKLFEFLFIHRSVKNSDSYKSHLCADLDDVFWDESKIQNSMYTVIVLPLKKGPFDMNSPYVGVHGTLIINSALESKQEPFIKIFSYRK